MEEPKNWEELDVIIKNQSIEAAIPYLVKELKLKLTPEQLEPFDNLESFILKQFVESPSTIPKDFVAVLVAMCKKGKLKKKS